MTYSEAADQSEADPLVQVNFYGEALCPYCARFLDTVAARIYDNGVMNMTRFRYIPYGNAKETQASLLCNRWQDFEIKFLFDFQDGTVCQHGPQECELNRILSCAIHLNPDQQVWFPFAKCLESLGPSKIQPLEPAEPCAQDASINYSAIQDCASGKLKACREYTCQMAVELQKKAAEETASLKPAHTYVPWVTVNGIAIGGAFEQLQTFICASYLGE
ncbi:MAG: hypothetical protein FRX49_05931, partial [Trebouxia sp. A1-2]